MHLNFQGVFFSFFKIVVYLIYNIVLISTVLQSDSDLYVYSHTHIYILLYILFHYGLSHDIDYISEL